MTRTLARPIAFSLILLIALAIILPPLQQLPRINAPLSEHAIVAHGEDAEEAKQCLEEGRGYLFFNPTGQKWGFVCWLGDRWGIVILSAAGAIITAFVTKCRHVREYMARQGYRDTEEQ